MMGRPERELEEIRNLRDSAQAVFQGDLEIIKAELAPGALRTRLTHLTHKAGPAVCRASDVAQEHRASLIGGIAAIAAGAGLWLARKPLGAVISAVKNRLGGSIEGATTDGSKDQ